MRRDNFHKVKQILEADNINLQNIGRMGNMSHIVGSKMEL